MSAKIWWQDVFSEEMNIDEAIRERFYDRIKKGILRVARNDTSIEIHHVKHSSFILDSLYLEMLNNNWVIDGIIEAEKQGFDAAIIGCGNDPALHEARQAVDIPVIGLTEAAMLLGCSLGNKIGIITVSDGCAALLEERIRLYRLEARIVYPLQVYKLNNPIADLFKMIIEPGSINPQFKDLCHKCVANGADVIIPACAALSPATTLAEFKEVPGTGVPVLDINEIAIKAAEMQIDLKRISGLGKSQKGLYKSNKPSLRDRMRQVSFINKS